MDDMGMRPYIEPMHGAHIERVDAMGIRLYIEPNHRGWMIWASAYMYEHG